MIAIFSEGLAPGACSLEARFRVEWGVWTHVRRACFSSTGSETPSESFLREAGGCAVMCAAMKKAVALSL